MQADAVEWVAWEYGWKDPLGSRRSLRLRYDIRLGASASQQVLEVGWSNVGARTQRQLETLSDLVMRHMPHEETKQEALGVPILAPRVFDVLQIDVLGAGRHGAPLHGESCIWIGTSSNTAHRSVNIALDQEGQEIRLDLAREARRRLQALFAVTLGKNVEAYGPRQLYLAYRAKPEWIDLSRRLALALSELGLFVWRDRNETGFGDGLDPAMETALKESSAAAMLLTPDFMEGNTTVRELDAIRARMKDDDRFIGAYVLHGVAFSAAPSLPRNPICETLSSLDETEVRRVALAIRRGVVGLAQEPQ